MPKAKRALTDAEYRQLASTDPIAAMEYAISEKMANILRWDRELTLGTNPTTAQVAYMKETRILVQEVQKYLGARTEDEKAREFFDGLQARLSTVEKRLDPPLPAEIDEIRDILADLYDTDSEDTGPPMEAADALEAGIPTVGPAAS